MPQDTKDFPWLKHYPQEIDWNAEIEPQHMASLLDETAEKFPHHVAVDFLGHTTTYAQINDLSKRVARGLQDRGFKKGDRIGLFLPNCPQYIIFYYGILRMGGIVVNANPLYSKHEIEHLIQDSGLTAMVTLDLEALLPKLVEHVSSTTLNTIIVCPMQQFLPFPKNILFPLLKRKEIADLSHESIVLFDDILGSEPLLPVEVNIKDDVALLQYTGGTTGVPKAAMLTHENLYVNTIQSRMWFHNAEVGKEITLAAIPFFHVFAMTVLMNLSVKLGLKIIAMPRFDLNDALKLITKKKVTVFPAVPTIYTAINQHKKIDQYDISSIRFCISGGAPLPVEVKRKFEQRTGGHLVEGYGLTESSPVAACNPLRGQNKEGSIGLPLPQTIFEIWPLPDDEDADHSKPLPYGETGEICIIGPQVMKGYWQNEEATNDTIIDGRLRTGDVGYIDEEGYIFIVDRLKDMILCGGYNVYPRHVEEAVYKHAAVEEVICAGLPDEYRGETVKIWVKLKDGQSLKASELKTFLKDYLSPIEMPKHIEFRDEPLPKTMIGKLSRKDILAEELEQ